MLLLKGREDFYGGEVIVEVADARACADRAGVSLGFTKTVVYDPLRVPLVEGQSKVKEPTAILIHFPSGTAVALYVQKIPL